MKLTFTHEGWFGICPVYIANLNSDEPDFTEKNPVMAPLVLISMLGYLVINTVRDALNMETGFSFWGVGRLSPDEEFVEWVDD